jgi:hypothetical protein
MRALAMMREARRSLKGLARVTRPEADGWLGSIFAFFLERGVPVGNQAVERFLCRAVAGDDIVMQRFLRGLQQRGA